jgi:hypothetical protein
MAAEGSSGGLIIGAVARFAWRNNEKSLKLSD